MPGAYPLTVDFPPGPERIPPVKVLTNWLIFIPQFIWLYILYIVAFFAAIVCWFSIVFTGTAPESLSDFIAGVIRYAWRVITGLFVWAEPYPPFAPIPQGFADPGGYPAGVSVTPVSGERNRVTVLIRIIMVIPQYIVLYFLNIANGVCLLISWFIALFTGQWNPSLKNFCIGVFRWQLRVESYFLLLTDEYPPFSLEP
ncbi:MAG TPA: DUF4389 domain-containing protein [Acidimicrobiales bacterium]